MDKSVLIVVPARGGSRGVPNKHMRTINGKPIIQFVVEAAINTNLDSRIVVSTDSRDIKNFVQKQFDSVYVIDRPSSMAQDNSPITESLVHAVEVCESLFAERYEEVVWLQANVPTTTSSLIQKTYEAFKGQPNATSAQTITPFPVPPEWSWWCDETGSMTINSNCYTYSVRRQDLKVSYHLNGAVNVLKKQVLCDPINHIGQDYFGNVRIGVIEELGSSIEIDSEADFALATLKLGGENQIGG